MRIPIFHLPDEERRPFLRGALLGSALSLALCAAGIGVWSATHSPIPLPNVPNVPVIVQATQPQQPVQPVVQAQPAAQPAPAAPAKPSPPQQENAVVRSGETFGDGRIAYFGGMEVPHEKTGENHGT